MSTNFNFQSLGWKAFEDLVGTIFREILGQTVQVFSDGADGGRDAAFYGQWNSNNGTEALNGKFCIQCKHTSKNNLKLSEKIYLSELEKIKKLTKNNLCDVYILVTNHEVSGGIAQKFEMDAKKYGVKQSLVFGEEWLNKIIIENPRLRRLVPRLYGLGDLTQIITNQAYKQAKAVLDSISVDLACFVPTQSYRQSAHALREHGFVLLLGEPASGKTMIANLLALSAADEWNLQTLMINSPSEFSTLWNTEDPGQFLWVDDAFGATQYDDNRAHEWNKLLSKMKAAIHAGCRIVFTSRDYIFQSAKKDLKISAFDLFDDSRVIIEVESLTATEREMILYNHLKNGNQPKNFKSQVKDFLSNASKVPKFLPEIARRFGNSKFTNNLPISNDSVQNFFTHPITVLYDVVSTLANAEKAAIGLIFTNGGKLLLPIPQNTITDQYLSMMNVTIGQVKNALTALDDSLIRRVSQGNSQFWTFRHPTIHDAYASYIGNDPELIDIYLAGVTTSKLLREVTCGYIKIQGAKIVIPESRFPLILERLHDYKPDPFHWSDPILIFLSTRCPPALISEYFKVADIGTCIPRSIWHITNEYSGLVILSLLNKSNLLHPDLRSLAADRIINISLQSHSTRFLECTPRSLLTDGELQSTLHTLKSRLLNDGLDIIYEFRDNWAQDDDPEQLYYEINETLNYIINDDGFDKSHQDNASSLSIEIKKIIEDMHSQINIQSFDSLDAEDAEEQFFDLNRSIFDDVDE